MDLKQRFAEELRYLRELGREFAEDNPQLAQFLGDKAGDPDVERLLEGFAFLTAKLGMKIDDDLPELTHPLLQMLWPNYLQQARATRKRLNGIQDAVTTPIDWLMKGLPVRGVQTRLRLDQDAFLCEGELYLFASVLSHFFALYASINSFHRLEVINTTNNECYEWPLLTGRQPVI